MEYSVDPTKNGEIFIIVKSMDEVPIDADYTEVPGGFRYKEKIGRNVTATSPLEAVSGRLNTDYGGKFIEAYESSFGPLGSPVKTNTAAKKGSGKKGFSWDTSIMNPKNMGKSKTKPAEEDDFSQYKR